MTCRHQDGDPECTTWPSRVKAAEDFLARAKRLQAKRSRADAPPTPDKKDYSIEDAYLIGDEGDDGSRPRHLVMKVRYRSCKSCAFEGVKVMVFLNCPSKAALLWREIDPHFRDPKAARHPTQAPSPDARFPGTEQGWKDALEYARRKAGLKR